ncbi:MAG TPA: type II secretion system F family protein [Candidatus Binataceae bacterium]
MDLLITGSIAGFVLLIGAILMLRFTGGPTATHDVLKRMSRPEATRVDDDIIKVGRGRDQGKRLLTALYQVNLLQRLEASMWQAGIYNGVADILIVIVLLFGAGFAAGSALTDSRLLQLGVGAGLASLPILYIRLRKAHRLKAFAVQLPYALDLMRSSLEAGHSLLRGLQVVVAEFADPMKSEFRSVIEQSRLGLPLPRALEEMLKRVPVEDLRLLVVAVKVQSEVGSSLAQIIGRLSEIVRTRQRLHLQIRSLTAQSRMSGMVVGFLPIAMLAAFSVIQPSYTHTLLYEPGGQKILKIAAVLDTLGFMTIRYLLKVRY